jgi:dTDP-4-dehydrorhamnose reductase
VRLLVAGAAGMLGVDVLRAAARAGHEAVGLTREELDVTEPGSIAGALGRTGPDALVNCAGWTDVDGAESRRRDAEAVNAGGAGNLATACAAAGIPLLHVSSDYVFAGDAPRDAAGAPRAYLESDPTGPRTVYGKTKLAGERLVLAASPRNTVVRTAWLFGAAGRSFPDTMLRLSAEGQTVRVVADQTGSPTWTGHLAPALVGLLERGVRGLVHLAGTGAVSWSGFAREVFRQSEVACRVEDATSAELARPAPRPAWSALESERADVLPLPPWQDGLAGFLAARAGIMRP